MHVIAAKAVAFKEALDPSFKTYQKQVVANARAMAKVFLDRGYKVVSNGTDNHLFLLDLIAKNVTGKDAEAALGKAHITVNKNSVPNDPKSPFVRSEEHTSELQSLMRISYAVFCLKKKKTQLNTTHIQLSKSKTT